MFGVAVARLDQVTPAEKDRYQALYCGLCLSIKEIYGNASRAALSYDMTFFAMLLSSLMEPVEESGRTRCISHPFKEMPFARSAYTDMAADLSIAMAYHKCLDDVRDGDRKLAHVKEMALKGPYGIALERVPEICAATEEAMERIAHLEQQPDTPPDACAQAFGELLGFSFGSAGGPWKDMLESFGESLGKLVYMMDAAIDFDQDRASGAYNPFVRLMSEADPVLFRRVLASLADDATIAFEKMPLERDLNLMRSVLYSGIWQKLNKAYPEVGNAH